MISRHKTITVMIIVFVTVIFSHFECLSSLLLSL